jgi:hypothetical protein
MHGHLATKRFGPVVLSFALIVAACGGGEMTLTEYVDALNGIVGSAIPQGEELFASPHGAVLAEGAQLADFTPQDLQLALETVGEIEREIREATDAIDPPETVADFHNRYFDTRFTSAREALATRAGAATTWEELAETPEMATYRTAVADDKQTCIDFQADLDATSERGVFADTPWIPRELSEVVIALLGCAVYPEHPDEMFRP